MVNWDGLVSRLGTSVVENFAVGKLSGRELTQAASSTTVSGTVRNLLRNRGVTYARRLARKALRRRGAQV